MGVDVTLLNNFPNVNPLNVGNPLIVTNGDSPATIIARDPQLTVSSPNSPANQAFIDDGFNIAGITKDRNGVTRDGNFDIGSSEFVNPNNAPSVLINSFVPADIANVLTELQLDDPDNDPVEITDVEYDAAGTFSGGEVSVLGATTGDFGPHATAGGPVNVPLVTDLTLLIADLTTNNAKLRFTVFDGTDTTTVISGAFTVLGDKPLFSFGTLSVEGNVVTIPVILTDNFRNDLSLVGNATF